MIRVTPRCRPNLSVLVVWLTAGCGGEVDRTSARKDLQARDTVSSALAFDVDPGVGETEAYVCTRTSAATVRERFVREIVWTLPSDTVRVHHATLYTTSGEAPVACDELPSRFAILHTIAPGGASLTLPEGVALHVPGDAETLVVQAHVLRFAPGGASQASVRWSSTTTVPTHTAVWLDVLAPVPAIRPHHVEVSSAACLLMGPVHLVSTWGHMHRRGRRFQGTLRRASGETVSYLDESPWDVANQPVRPLDLDAAAGDAIETRCTWENPTDEYVLPGVTSNDEMCTQGVVAWPEENARCQ